MWRLLVAVFFWGVNWPVIKIVLGGAGPWTIRAAGLAGGAAMLLLYARAVGQSLVIPREHWRTLVLAALLNVAGFNIFAVFAQLSMPTSRAAILTFTMPVWAALFGWLFLAETIDRWRTAAIAIGMAGIGVLSVPFWPVVQAGGLPFGLVYVLGAAMSWAAGTVLLKRYPIAAAPLASTVWQVGIAAFVCLIGMLAFERPYLDLTEPRRALAFAYHIVFPQAMSYVLWFNLLTRVPASTASIGTLLIPIVGVGSAIILLDDWPTQLDLVGLALILAAVILDQIVQPKWMVRSVTS